ncbi:hypothetical protein CMV_013330, partial [Castanea mollissima]
VQSDHYEVVADLVQTSFLFSIPMDGPMSFSTPHVSVQWSLRFEFFTTPKNVDWTRYEHPLLIGGRDKMRNSSLWIHCGCIIERIRFLHDTGRPNQLKYKCLSQISAHEAQKLFSIFGQMSIEMYDWQFIIALLSAACMSCPIDVFHIHT